jgi:hypothetical protein
MTSIVKQQKTHKRLLAREWSSQRRLQILEADKIGIIIWLPVNESTTKAY